MNQPLFVAGCMRSGTTLLMIARLEPHDRRPATRELFHGELLWRALRGAWTYAEAFDVVSQELAASVGKSRWADKTPGNELFAKDILELFPGSRILSVLRDHRDVITSKREKERGSDDPAAFSWIKSRRGDYFWRPSIEAHFWNLTHLPRERYATLLYEDLSRMIVEKGGRTFYNPASATSPYPRGGRSNTSAHRDSLAQYEISARSVASYAKRFGRIELMIARRVFGNGDGVAITSWKAFGIRERRYAWKPTRKAKFGCRQIGRRLGD